MTRTLLTASVAALIATSTSAAPAEAGNGFGIKVGGVKIGTGPGGVKISLPGKGRPGHKPPIGIHPPGRPPVHPPIVIRPPVRPPVKPPIVIRPPVRPPVKPPIVIRPPVRPPVHPPIVIRPPVHPPKRPIPCPPPVVEPPVVVHPPVVQPPVIHPPIVEPGPPVPTSAWYFGMACERVQTQFGIGLRVATLAPGGPAANHGLNVGDVLLLAGSVNLSQATSNTHGATLVQSGVSRDGVVQFTLVQSTNGMLANLTMAPQPTAAPAPTAATTIALNPADASSTM